MTIVPVGVDAQGNINIAELKQKAEQHKVGYYRVAYSRSRGWAGGRARPGAGARRAKAGQSPSI